MSEPDDGVRVNLVHDELVALYMLLNRNEPTLDTLQRDLLERFTALLYDRLCVSEMEDIEEYYRSLTNEGQE